MAREFGAEEAVVVLCARDEAEFQRALADLAARGVRAHTFVCGVTDGA